MEAGGTEADRRIPGDGAPKDRRPPGDPIATTP